MNEGLKDYIQAMGALAEAMALFRRKLMKNGFTRDEALELTKVYLNNLTRKEDKDNGQLELRPQYVSGTTF